jgi:methylthioxylose transferase
VAATATLTHRPAGTDDRRAGHRARPVRPVAPAAFIGVAAWVVVVVAALVWGTLVVAGSGVSLRAAPLMGHWAWDGGPSLAPALLVGAAVARWGPGVAARAPWRAVPALTSLGAVAWAAALAASDGWHRLTAPLTTRHEYEPFAAGIDDLGGFVAGFTAGLGDYPIHVQGHPPGPVVLAWLLDRVGLGGAGWLALLALGGWGAATAAALVAARAVAGERVARRAAPALVVLPAAVWAGTSLDALFAGLTATGCALAIVALTRPSPARAVGAGAVLGLALLFSYGAAVMLAVPGLAAVVLARARPSRRLAPAHSPRGVARAARLRALTHWAACVAAGGLGVVAAAGAAGYWWFDGLAATRAAYWAGVGAERPGWYLTLVGNPAALALATGPAAAAGLAGAAAGVRRARDWRPALLPAAASAALLVADLSQLSRGEVERIWLPFVPWLALAAPGDRRGWLTAQVVVALALQACLASPW